MSELLFLAHRIPFPPDRGDKMRSFHILRRLCRETKVHLGCFADHPAEAAQADALREAVGSGLGELHVEPVAGSRLAWTARAIRRREPVNLAAFHSAAMERFAAAMLARPAVSAVYAFSVQMAQFVPPRARQRFVMDFVDFDSAKYAAYGDGAPTPRRLLYRREAQRLLAFERSTAERADVSLFISEAEAELFLAAARPRRSHVRVLANGVDLGRYDPALTFPDPAPGGPLIVFTGQMDYPPNVEAVARFAGQALPAIRRARPDARFAIVGRNPAPAVAKLAGDGVIVTGEVPDTRPWLAAAQVVVAPLEVARGVQNKVLEAMAMARPVVASSGAFTGIDAAPGRELVVADGAAAQAEAVLALIADPAAAAALGRAARARLEACYSWEAKLASLPGLVGLAPLEAAA